jgi:hypothetical protein
LTTGCNDFLCDKDQKDYILPLCGAAGAVDHGMTACHGLFLVRGDGVEFASVPVIAACLELFDGKSGGGQAPAGVWC